MQLYFAEDLITTTVTLDKEESHHVIHVMRLHAGSTIDITDGKGTLANGIISAANPKTCVVEILQRKQEHLPRNYALHIAIAPTKNIDRLEWFLEKATEIGIDTITPLLCQRSERKIINEDRLTKMVVAAAKQSLKTFFPVLNPLTSFKDFIDRETDGIKLIAHCYSSERKLLKDCYTPGSRAKNVLILIGPEGDFDEVEIELAEKNGFKSISLGDSRLRTETAGLVACQSIAFMNQ